MPVEWPVVRRAMLTQINLFPDNPRANCMSTYIGSEQVDIAIRCIRAFYQGLLWADQFGIHGGYAGNRNFQQVFLIDDTHTLGVFDNRNFLAGSGKLQVRHPTSTVELVNAYHRGQGNIKTLIVLEKDNYRLANSDTVGHQSKFLIDVVYPAMAGIRAKLTGDYDGSQWKKSLANVQRVSTDTPTTNTRVARTNFLSDIYHRPHKADERLMGNSPLKLFYRWNSPLNVEFTPENKAPGQLLPHG